MIKLQQHNGRRWVTKSDNHETLEDAVAHAFRLSIHEPIRIISGRKVVWYQAGIVFGSSNTK